MEKVGEGKARGGEEGAVGRKARASKRNALSSSVVSQAAKPRGSAHKEYYRVRAQQG